MNVKRSVLFVILLAVVSIGQQACTKKTTPANAVPEAKNTTPANAAPVFVPMPDDIQCSMRDFVTRYTVGKDSMGVTATFSSVKKVTCWITGNNHGRKKEIDLVSTEINNGMLSTKEFGQMKLEAPNIGTNNVVTISIQQDKLQTFRAFLQQ
jgi:hypothetical protein